MEDGFAGGERLGFSWLKAWAVSSNFLHGHLWAFGFPLWFPAAVFAAPPGLWLLRRIHRRPRPGHCPHCGYDLRGNVSGVCPECGEVKQ
jgi:hypothetical protein